MIVFEDKIPDLQTLIRKRKAKWGKMLPPSMDFDDVESILLTHLFKKWPLYDQTKPFNNWANRVISNQIINIVRNNYVSFADMEKTDDYCEESFKRWERAQNRSIKVPTSYDNLEVFLGQEAESEIHVDYDLVLEKIKTKMHESFGDKHYRVFEMIYFEETSDEEIGKFLNSKTSEVGRKAGYGWLSVLKKRFKQRVIEILQEDAISGSN